MTLPKNLCRRGTLPSLSVLPDWVIYQHLGNCLKPVVLPKSPKISSKNYFGNFLGDFLKPVVIFCPNHGNFLL